MSGSLLQEYEIMQNPAIGANAIWAFAQGFISYPQEKHEHLTLWHIFTILPLVFHGTSRKVIIKRRESSGLRSILDREPSISLAQNEAIFNLENRIMSMEKRTLRSLNLAIACNLVTLENGNFTSRSNFKLPKNVQAETKAVLKAANKLGIWAGNMSIFEYLTILGVEPNK
ncbi:three component ABC system middle component [Rossellomorea aquimaris]|uniref:three component ABC system middle component n=1 Tax=Rossellomorea aquimaris TaxID=189382 RepID=UPI0005C8C0EE|nr:three component ABC system middle component [Rossellomorea aquimaris]